MATFKNLKDLEKYLKEKIDNSLEKEVASMVKAVQTDHIVDDVYMAYNNVNGGRQEPYVYKRRYFQGGLIDRENMQSEVNDGTLTVTNIAETNPNYAGSPVENLAGLIEYGHENGYGQYDYTRNRDGTEWQYMQPRPFIENTRDDIAKNKLHVKALKEALKRRLGNESVK